MPSRYIRQEIELSDNAKMNVYQCFLLFSVFRDLIDLMNTMSSNTLCLSNGTLSVVVY